MGIDGVILDVGVKVELWNFWVGFNFFIKRKWFLNLVKEINGCNKEIKVLRKGSSNEKVFWCF